MFVSEDRKLRVVHLILDFQPLFDKFQDVGHAIRAGDLRLARINISVPGYLAREDITQVNLPARRSPHEAAVLREETASSRLSLKTEIDQFHLEDKKEEQEKPVVQVLDLEDEPDKFFRCSHLRSRHCMHRQHLRGRRRRNGPEQEEKPA